MKTCVRCELELPISAFKSRGGKQRTLLQSWCTDCVRTYSRDHNHARDLREKYGITFEEYEEMLLAQEGKCFLCGSGPNGGKTRLTVDHDHATGKIRGLLCSFCNLGLGHFRDDPELLRRAADYLAGSN